MVKSNGVGGVSGLGWDGDFWGNFGSRTCHVSISCIRVGFLILYYLWSSVPSRGASPEDLITKGTQLAHYCETNSAVPCQSQYCVHSTHT